MEIEGLTPKCHAPATKKGEALRGGRMLGFPWISMKKTQWKTITFQFFRTLDRVEDILPPEAKLMLGLLGGRAEAP